MEAGRSSVDNFKIRHVFKSVCQRIVAEHSMRVVIDNGNPYNLISSITKRKLNPFRRFNVVHSIPFVSLTIFSMKTSSHNPPATVQVEPRYQG